MVLNSSCMHRVLQFCTAVLYHLIAQTPQIHPSHNAVLQYTDSPLKRPRIVMAKAGATKKKVQDRGGDENCSTKPTHLGGECKYPSVCRISTISPHHLRISEDVPKLPRFPDGCSDHYHEAPERTQRRKQTFKRAISMVK